MAHTCPGHLLPSSGTNTLACVRQGRWGRWTGEDEARETRAVIRRVVRFTLEENFAVDWNGAMSASANETWRMREEVSGQASKDEHVETHDRSS